MPFLVMWFIVLQTVVVFSCMSSIATFETTCPPAEDIYPCSCQQKRANVDVTCEHLTSLSQLKTVADGIKGFSINQLKIDNSNISDVPNDLLEGVRIQHLYFDVSEIRTEGGGLRLLGLEDSLSSWKIFYSYTSQEQPMPSLSLGHQRALRSLHLRFNYAPLLGNDWFAEGPKGLKTLELVGNEIKELGSEAFAALEQLSTLKIAEERQIVSVSRSMLPRRSAYLKTIRLFRTGLTNLPEDFFSDLPALEQVDLHNNGFVTLPETAWSSVWDQLKVIDMFQNPIECDSRIQWILTKPLFSSKLEGKCETPEKLAGRDIASLEVSDLE